MSAESSNRGSTVDLATTTQEVKPRPSRRGSETRQRTVLVALRLLPAEWKTLQAAAQDRNVSLSDFLRSSALKAADEVDG